jgi:hypothetical protein
LIRSSHVIDDDADGLEAGAETGSFGVDTASGCAVDAETGNFRVDDARGCAVGSTLAT